MTLWYLVRGIALGFSIAAPVGPIGVLCIRRTLAHGRLTGLVSGLGAATADMLYGAIAAFGITAVSALLVRQQIWIHLLGALFLGYLGLKTLVAKPVERAARVEAPGLAGAYGSTLLLTLTNPATIVSFAAIFAGVGLAGTHPSYGLAALMTLGVFCGSALWWLLLSGAVSLVRERVSLRALRWVNVLSGCVLLSFAVFALVTA